MSNHFYTNPANSHYFTLPPEHQHRSPKMKAICEVLFVLDRPLTRTQIMSELGCKNPKTSNLCYFRRMHTNRFTNCYGKRNHDEARYSVVINGLVKICGKKPNGELLYTLTDAGQDLAIKGMLEISKRLLEKSLKEMGG